MSQACVVHDCKLQPDLLGSVTLLPDAWRTGIDERWKCIRLPSEVPYKTDARKLSVKVDGQFPFGIIRYSGLRVDISTGASVTYGQVNVQHDPSRAQPPLRTLGRYSQYIHEEIESKESVQDGPFESLVFRQHNQQPTQLVGTL